MYERYESFEKMWNIYKQDILRKKFRPFTILSKTLIKVHDPLVTDFSPENKETIYDHQATPNVY